MLNFQLTQIRQAPNRTSQVFRSVFGSEGIGSEIGPISEVPSVRCIIVSLYVVMMKIRNVEIFEKKIHFFYLTTYLLIFLSLKQQ